MNDEQRDQLTIDEQNARFWDELCGSILAVDVGVSDRSAESLRRYDDAYMGIYPYLPGYLPSPAAPQARVLEIGLGYGTVAQVLAERGWRYHGLDIAKGPVEMARHRLRMLGESGVEERVVAGSVHAIPHDNASLDAAVTIGCLHHTGDIAAGIHELHRVLKPGGKALVMVYNARSWRRFRADPMSAIRATTGLADEVSRHRYDQNAEGEAAPETVFTSKRGLEQMFSDWTSVTIARENFDPVVARGRIVVPRPKLLGNVAKVAGLDLYATAVK